MARPDQRSDEAKRWRRWYGTPQWQAIRAQQLAEHPLCQACRARGRITAATVCNHVDKDAKATREGFFAGPFTSLCTPCHDAGEQKTEAAGFSGACDASGWPTDSRHPANRRG